MKDTHPLAALLALALLASCSTARIHRTDQADLDRRIEQVEAKVALASVRHDVPLDLLMGLIWVESRFDPGAVSRVGARGLTQLMPRTAAAMARRLGLPKGAADPHDPSFAIEAGAAYLALLIERFDGDVDYALAAYNAGPGAVARALRRTGRPPRAAVGYADDVQAARNRFRSTPLVTTHLML